MNSLSKEASLSFQTNLGDTHQPSVEYHRTAQGLYQPPGKNYDGPNRYSRVVDIKTPNAPKVYYVPPSNTHSFIKAYDKDVKYNIAKNMNFLTEKEVPGFFGPKKRKYLDPEDSRVLEVYNEPQFNHEHVAAVN